MTTATKDLRDVVIEHINEHEEKDTYKMALDSSLTPEVSVRAFELYFDEFNYQAMELLTKITGMYIFSGVKSLENRLLLIVNGSTLPAIYKLEAAKALVLRNADDADLSVKDIGYNALNAVCRTFEETSIPTPVQVDALYLLMHSETHRMNSSEYFIKLTNNQVHDCEYRYKLILTLEFRVKNSEWHLQQACMAFLMNSKNRTLHRILASQNLFAHGVEQKDFISCILLSFATDVELDYNLRADAADVVLKYGSDGDKLRARDIILILGSQDRHGTFTIYQNAQNVHNDTIEQAVIDIIQYLSTIDIKDLTFDKVADALERVVERDDAPNFIKISLNRIHMDRALYSTFNYSLQNILVRVFACIENAETAEIKKVLRSRLDQELTEMAGTCSTGFLGRLCNVLSGFNGLNMRISWEDQITANFGARMNARLAKLSSFLDENQRHDLLVLYCGESDEKEPAVGTPEHDRFVEIAIDEFKTNVCLEMTLDPSCYEERVHYLKFSRMMFPSILEELAKEFAPHVQATDFDLYMRKALVHYEGQVVL